ncbi:MAG: hypothetical protein HQL67_01960 [Magnetococcales bacterium]|nr:hypothetical protein [Magnetococcales bacterium]
MTLPQSSSGMAHSGSGIKAVEANRFFSALDHPKTEVKKKAIVGLIARTELSQQYQVPLISFSRPDEQSLLMASVYNLFGGRSKFEATISHSSWQQAIDEKKQEILSELNLPFFKRQKKLLLFSGTAGVLVLAAVLLWPESDPLKPVASTSSYKQQPVGRSWEKNQNNNQTQADRSILIKSAPAMEPIKNWQSSQRDEPDFVDPPTKKDHRPVSDEAMADNGKNSFLTVTEASESISAHGPVESQDHSEVVADPPAAYREMAVEVVKLSTRNQPAASEAHAPVIKPESLPMRSEAMNVEPPAPNDLQKIEGHQSGFVGKKQDLILRYWRSPYETAPGDVDQVDSHFELLPLANGDIYISISDMMGRTVLTEDDHFTINKETLGDIRLVFQVVPRQAYLFSFNSEGVAIIPKPFWESFAQMSSKWVGVSRVLKVSPTQWFHIRDIASKRVSDILADFRENGSKAE